jgi:hypothetical protein
MQLAERCGLLPVNVDAPVRGVQCEGLAQPLRVGGDAHCRDHKVCLNGPPVAQFHSNQPTRPFRGVSLHRAAADAHLMRRETGFVPCVLVIFSLSGSSRGYLQELLHKPQISFRSLTYISQLNS